MSVNKLRQANGNWPALSVRRLFRPILVQFCLLWLFACWHSPGLAQAPKAPQDHGDLISERAWLDDPTNSLGPDQVRVMTGWTPYSGPLRRGFRESTTWLKLRLEPIAHGERRNPSRESRIVLRILPGHLDEIALFDPRRPSERPLLAGDTYDWKLGEYRSFNQNLVIDSPAEPLEILLRLRTTSHHGIHVEALTWGDIEAADRRQHLIIGAVVIFLTMILAWAINAWFERPDRVIAAFIVHQSVSLLFTLVLLGFVRVYLSDFLSANVISLINSVAFPVTTIAVLWFHWNLIREFTPHPIFLRCVKWLVLLMPITLLLIFEGFVRQALQITLIVTMLTPLLLLLAIASAPRRLQEDVPRLSRRYMIMSYSLMLVILWNASLPAFGWLPSPPWAMYSAISYGVVSAAILLSILRSRAKYLDEVSRRTQTQLALTAQALEQERSLRQEQDQFITMLTHEITNSLATAQLAIGGLDPKSSMRARGYRAIEGLRDIMRRCILSGEIESKKSLVQTKSTDLQKILQETRDQIERRDLIHLRIDPDLPRCETDGQLLRIVIGNLLDNAVKYRAVDSLVDVRATKALRDAKTGLQVVVSNEPGESGQPDPEMVFKKYWRGPGAARLAGSGLGLYLSSMIASRLGGDLRYRYEAPYVRFVLWLPT